jgi:hypothetical protein
MNEDITALIILCNTVFPPKEAGPAPVCASIYINHILVSCL